MRERRAPLLWLCLLGSACASDRAAPDPVAAPVVWEVVPADELDDPHDGPWLYERNCSGCHGLGGAGDGETARQLGVQPRDFNAGGFSFGNTPEALFRTISSGIPGRSVMPAFGGILSEDERRLIVEHVLTLMPPQPEQDARASVLEVGARPVIARGKLPPLAEGAPQHPRGLLLGTPEGLTFEYDVQDVRLLAVRLGGFADREDWRDRGGGYLRPLGQPIYTLAQEGARSPFEVVDGRRHLPLRARLRASFDGPEAAGLEYDLLDARDVAVARVRETCRAVPLSAGGAFERRLTFEGGVSPSMLSLTLAGDARSNFSRAWPEGLDRHWFIGAREGGEAECVWLEGPPQFGFEDTEVELRVQIALKAGGRAELTAIVLQLPDSDPARLAALAEELSR